MKSCAKPQRLLACEFQVPREHGNHIELLEFEAHEDDGAAQLREIIFVRAANALDEPMEP